MARPLETAAKGPYLLINHANTNDRFHLLEDVSVPASDLDISIHPIFQQSNFVNATANVYQNLNQSLRLASMFIHHDTVLEWFVAPLFGIPLFDVQSKKTYLSDPLSNKTPEQRAKLIQRVRDALNCLAHCVRFKFFTSSTDHRFYARTTMDTRQPMHHSLECNAHFDSTTSVMIDLRKQYLDFLDHHYATSTHCERLRHDFCLAVALVHEVCHAVGVARRGDLKEPHLRLDHLAKPELGYAWENFMFGGIINPFDRDSTKVSFLMWKIWADESVAMASGGKEWAAVPMSYIAQWFQKDTWSEIARSGPGAVPPPPVKLKIKAQKNHYTVLTDNEAAVDDVQMVRYEISELYNRGGQLSATDMAVLVSRASLATPERLQEHPVPVPPRTGSRQCSMPIECSITKSLSDRNLVSLPSIQPKRPRSASPLKRAAVSCAETTCELAPSRRPRKRTKR